MFITLTCDTYGKVTPGGTPADPGAYDYQRAARDCNFNGSVALSVVMGCHVLPL